MTDGFDSDLPRNPIDDMAVPEYVSSAEGYATKSKARFLKQFLTDLFKSLYFESESQISEKTQKQNAESFAESCLADRNDNEDGTRNDWEKVIRAAKGTICEDILEIKQTKDDAERELVETREGTVTEVLQAIANEFGVTEQFVIPEQGSKKSPGDYGKEFARLLKTEMTHSTRVNEARLSKAALAL